MAEKVVNDISNIDFDQSLFDNSFYLIIKKSKRESNMISEKELVSIICMIMAPGRQSFKIKAQELYSLSSTSSKQSRNKYFDKEISYDKAHKNTYTNERSSPQ